MLTGFDGTMLFVVGPWWFKWFTPSIDLPMPLFNAFATLWINLWCKLVASDDLGWAEPRPVPPLLIGDPLFFPRPRVVLFWLCVCGTSLSVTKFGGRGGGGGGDNGLEAMECCRFCCGLAVEETASRALRTRLLWWISAKINKKDNYIMGPRRTLFFALIDLNSFNNSQVNVLTYR